MQAKFEGRPDILGLCHRRETVKGNEQALRGHRIGDRDAYQRSQEPLKLDAQSKFGAHANKLAAAPHQLTTAQTLHNASIQNVRPVVVINACCGSEVTLGSHFRMRSRAMAGSAHACYALREVEFGRQHIENFRPGRASGLFLQSMDEFEVKRIDYCLFSAFSR